MQGPFDITKKLFSASDSQNMSLQDKLSLFFEDYSFVPLFIQENYLLSNPMQARYVASSIPSVKRDIWRGNS